MKYQCTVDAKDSFVEVMPCLGVDMMVTVKDDDLEASMFLSYADARKLAADLISLADANEERTAQAKREAEPKPQGFMALSPLAQKMVQHMRRAGSISAREAMNDYGVSSGSMVRRICDIEEAGFKVKRDKRKHPMTGRQYTRYSLVEV